jgi:DNA-binding CsgD family transcriptional regulator
MVGAARGIAVADAAGLAFFDSALSLPDIDRWQWDRARTELAYGERLRRARSNAEARHHLGAALDIFERIGARPWADRAAKELRAAGRQSRAAAAPDGDTLTAQELEIAQLAASGLSNRQIGERLFLSHRTVEFHLHRLFPKLGITSRAALRDALDALPDR